MLGSSHSNFPVWFGRTVLAGIVWLSVAVFTFIIGCPAIVCYGIQIAGIWVPVAGITAIGLLGIVFLIVGKLKMFIATEADTAEIWTSLASVCSISGICFFLTAFVVYKAVSPVFEGVGWALTTQHEVPQIFLGKIVSDPGVLFYPLMLSIKSSPLTLPLSLIGFLFLHRQRHNPEYARTYQIYAGLAVFVILFAVCMALGAKKMSRYLLPIFPILDILTAVSVHILVEKLFQTGIFRWRQDRKMLVSNGLKVLTVGIIVFVQVTPVLSLQPHYGTYYNPCWKLTDITKICSFGGGYGLDLAADYLNKKPDPQDLIVRVSPLSEHFFSQYFKGESYPRSTYRETRSPDYEVVYIRDVQINKVPLSDIGGTLEHIIRLNEIDYVWKNGKSQPNKKTYLSEVKAGKTIGSLWPYNEVGSTHHANEELASVMGKGVFDNPKGTQLIQRVFQTANLSSDDIILDSFAGSGTTGHAVLALNRADGGNRKFILIECEDYADTITAERVRRVITGVPNVRDDALREGLGGFFTYCTLGKPIEVEALLTGETLPSYSALAANLLYTTTGVSVGVECLAPQNDDGLFYSDAKNDYYLLYQPALEYLRSDAMILNLTRAKRIQTASRETGRKAIVYAAGNYTGQRELTRMGIIFCQLPHALHER